MYEKVPSFKLGFMIERIHAILLCGDITSDIRAQDLKNNSSKWEVFGLYNSSTLIISEDPIKGMFLS